MVRDMPTVHIIGAGLSGLAAATLLAERHIPVNLYEAQTLAGGRARASLMGGKNQPFDHGVYSVMGNFRHSWKLIDRVKAANQWQPLPRYCDYVDIEHGTAWTLKSPLFMPRAPLADYLKPLRLMSTRRDVPVTDILSQFHPLYESWVKPMTRIALGVNPEQASAKQLASVLRRNALSGRYVPRHSIHTSLIAPALQFLEAHGAAVYFGHTLKNLEGNEHITKLGFTRKKKDLGEKDVVILATPPHVACAIDPSIAVPTQQQAIITVHFLTPHREPECRMLGLVGANADYVLFRHEQMVAVCHAAEHLFNLDNETLAERLWKQIRVALPYLPQEMPPFQMLKERNAGFVSTTQLTRPAIHTRVSNLFLAGDYTASHLPASIEGAIMSGHAAAESALKTIKH